MLRSACYPCLIKAETEPPGRLHTSTGSPYEPQRYTASIGCSGLLRGLFRHRQSGFRARTLGPFFSSSRRPATSYEPLYVSSILADVAQRQTWYAATPGAFRLCQSPLGAYLLPQAPTSVALSRHRGGTFASSGGRAFSSALADSHANPFFLADS